MRLQRGFTNKEWAEIGEKYGDGGVHMFRGKKTFFWNGEKLWDENGECLFYDEEERETWKVIIVLPGVVVIPEITFFQCLKVETVIMADTVRRIDHIAFFNCYNLKFVKLSRNLEYIGQQAFFICVHLTSIFIPPSCREIGDKAFSGCTSLIILGLSQNTTLGRSLFERTALIKKSPIEVDENGEYDEGDDETAKQWIKSVNNEEVYALHRACASYNPLCEIIHDIVKRQGIKAMRMSNSIGITPSQYLEANKFADISEKDIINRYILDMMGEVL